MKKGFTLIELLAVIVILAIIALIATPIIMGIINDTRESADLRSAELYMSSVEYAIARKNLTEQLDGVVTCTIAQDTTVTCNNGTTSMPITVEIDRKATGGTITLTNGKVTNISNLTFDGTKTYSTNANGVLAKNAQSSEPVSEPEQSNNEVSNKICTLEDGYTSKEVGARYTCTVKDDVYFYVLEDDLEEDIEVIKDDNISLIMDRNYTDSTVPERMAWCDPNGDFPEDNVCDHDNLDPLIAHIQSTFNTTGVIVSLPTYDQILNAIGGEENESPTWLYDCPDESGAFGYWTSSPYYDSSDGAWIVYNDGDLDGIRVDAGDAFGVRPVITISKSLLD